MVYHITTDKQIEESWNNAHKMKGKNSDVFKKDGYGNVMHKSFYGKQSDMGWKKNRKKSDTSPYKK